MSTTFSRTLRALNEGAPRRKRVQIAVAIVLIAVWTAWAFAGKVSRVVVSQRARFDSPHTVHLSFAAAGRVTAVNLALGSAVRRNDVLVELDAAQPLARRVAAQANIDSLERRIAAAGAQIAATRALAAAEARSFDSRLREANERRIEEEHLTAIESDKAGRLEQMLKEGLVPLSDVTQARSRVEAARARLRGLDAAADDVASQKNDAAAGVEARLRELESARLQIDTQLAAERADLRQADIDIERLRVRAPAAGRIDSAAELRPGMWVDASTKVASIVPAERGDVTAYFPLDALPYVAAGQPASVWLEPLGRGGRRHFPALVTGVERDAAGGEFKVTLRVRNGAAGLTAVDAGFPVVATIEVQRLSPIDALLRAAGMLPGAERGP